MASLNPSTPDQLEAKKRVTQLNQDLKQETLTVQYGIIEITHLKERTDDCMMKKCSELQRALEKETQEQEQMDIRAKEMQAKGEFIKNAQQYLSERYFSLNRALAVEQANSCIEECQRPQMLIKRQLTHHFQEIQQNIQACCRTCEKVDTEKKSKEIDYNCVASCLESNIDILKSVNHRLQDEFKLSADKLFF
eukprot:403348811